MKKKVNLFFIYQQEAIDAFCSDYSITVEKKSYLKQIPSNQSLNSNDISSNADLLDFNAKRRMVKFFILNSSETEKYNSFRISDSKFEFDSKTKSISTDTSITMGMEEYLTLVSDKSFRKSYLQLWSDENVEQMTMEDAKNSLVMHSSQFQSLCSTKSSSETLQNLPYFIYTKILSCFFQLSLHTTLFFPPNECRPWFMST